MKTTMIIKNNTVNYVEDSKAPKMIVDKETFFTALNKILSTRYRDDVIVKLQTAKNTLAKLTKERDENSDTLESDEYKTLLTKIEKKENTITELTTLLEELKNKVAEYSSFEVPSSIEQVVTVYSFLYSNVVGITDKNKTMTGSLKGLKTLYNTCKEYTDVYNNVEDWTDARKNDFLVIKSALIEFGSRINGDADEYRKSFKYSASSKDVNQIINYVSSHAKHNKNNGKIGTTRNDFKSFQEIVIATIFRIDKDTMTSSNEVEV